MSSKLNPLATILNVDEDLDTVYEKLYTANTKWKNIGMGLKINSSTLDEIDKNCPQDCDKALQKMLQVWFETKEPTWEKLCKCLCKVTVKRNVLAKEIQDYVMQQAPGLTPPETIIEKSSPNLLAQPSDAVTKEPSAALNKLPTKNKCETCEQAVKHHVLSQDQGAEGKARAMFPRNRLWDKTHLKVYFLNTIPSTWKYNGHKYPVPGGEVGHVFTQSDILRLANCWTTKQPPSIPKEKREKVPIFVSACDAMDSDVRVWFSKSGGSHSTIGTEAGDITEGSKEENATMRLNLSIAGDRYTEHLVMHEFGHALGLGHEHQTVFFWNNIGKFFRKDVVENKFGQEYLSDVASYKDQTGETSEYDPDSIMHYDMFEPDWLQDEYNTEAKVDQHPNITSEQKRALKGFLQRKGKGLAEEISKTDFDFIAETYYAHNHTNTSKLNPQVPHPPAAHSAQKAPAKPTRTSEAQLFNTEEATQSGPKRSRESDPPAVSPKRAKVLKPGKIEGDLVLMKIGEELGDKWMNVGMALRMNFRDLKNTIEDNPKIQHHLKPMEMFQKWKREAGDSCTYAILASALEEVGLVTCAQTYCYEQ